MKIFVLPLMTWEEALNYCTQKNIVLCDADDAKFILDNILVADEPISYLTSTTDYENVSNYLNPIEKEKILGTFPKEHFLPSEPKHSKRRGLAIETRSLDRKNLMQYEVVHVQIKPPLKEYIEMQNAFNIRVTSVLETLDRMNVIQNTSVINDLKQMMKVIADIGDKITL